MGACAVVAVGAMVVEPIRKHLLWYFGMAVGIAAGLTTARHFFLGTDFLGEIVLVISGSLGAAIGTLGGRFLERRLNVERP